MRNWTSWVVAFLLVGSVAGVAPVSATPAVSAELITPATSGQGGVPAPKGRLKFKSSGPVCMCAEGLSEKDIEQALAKARSEKGADKSADPNSGSGRIQANNQEKQEKPHNLGVAK